ncbi:MAG: hypothetical protein M3112_10380 [Actinomycetia bacterium]|nr:hypothetical protein [Actinomycetes bacterium]
MKPTVDDMFKQARSLSLQLDALPDDDPRRTKLIRKRDRLRSEAQDRANSARHPLSVDAEASMLLARLAEIDDLFVSKGYAEKHLTKGFSDPGAYSATINRRLAEDHAQEIEAIEQRLSELAEIFPDDDDS